MYGEVQILNEHLHEPDVFMKIHLMVAHLLCYCDYLQYNEMNVLLSFVEKLLSDTNLRMQTCQL